jgi:putative peptide zinc metalloprotease protein
VKQSSLYSENWYKVAKLHLRLSFHVNVHKQNYLGDIWYLLEEKTNHKYFRLQDYSYLFIQSLDIDKTVDENWQAFVKKYPDHYPTQDDVIKLLAQLHSNNLLYFKNQAQHQHILERSLQKKRQELKQKIVSFLFIKIPLYDPNHLLDRLRLGTSIFSKPMVVFWLVIMFIGSFILFSHMSELFTQTQNLIAPDNLFLLFISMFGLKLVHELGHGLAVKRYGGNVNTFGVMFLVFTPLPFVDATNSWAFSNKYHRIIVSLAGMYVELFIASLALMVWSVTGEGLLNSLAFNLFIAGSLTSLLFNGNPLLKFDAYFALSDYWEIPNLYQRARNFTVAKMKEFLFGVPRSDHEIEGIAKKLVGYAVLSYVYKIFISIGIIFFVADQWFFLGVIVFIISFYTLVLKPLGGYFHYIFYHQELYKIRNRVIGASVLATLVGLWTLFMVPFENSVKVNGIVSIENSQKVYASSEGEVERIAFRSGDQVRQGDLIVHLKNEALTSQKKLVDQRLEALRLTRNSVLKTQLYQLEMIDEKVAVLQLQRDKLNKEIEDLAIRSTMDGTIVYDHHFDRQKDFITKHTKVAEVYPAKKVYRFIGVLTQEQISKLFDEPHLRAKIRLFGNLERIIEPTNLVIIPNQKTVLRSAALGWLGGGEIAVSPSDPTQALNPFFEIHGSIAKSKIKAYHEGQLGVMKIYLEPMTLAKRAETFLKQLMQKKYRL